MLVPKHTGFPSAISHPIRPLELRQYRYFVILAEELHFARAAERIGVGQSNLSREIKALEQQMGLKLFYRTSRHTELTAAGERFIEAARRVLAAEEHARLAIRDLRRNTKERLRIGICERVACSRIAAVLSAWRCANPDVELQIVSRSGRSLLAEIESGLLDAGISALQVAEPGIAIEKLWTDRWVVALPQDHPIASARAIELAEIAREPLALFLPAPGDTFERRLLDQVTGLDPALFIAERPSSASALVAWVGAGCGVGPLTASQCAGVTHPHVILRPLRRGFSSAEVCLLRGRAPPSTLMLRLVESLRANPA